MFILGFDPGGIGQFGWCVGEHHAAGQVRVLEAGTVDSAPHAVRAALAQIPDSRQVGAAGIDSPLFWSPVGDRQVDRLIRAAMTALGALNVHGTVQQVNSLRGACVAQGIMLAHLLRLELPAIRLTESHPKALLWLLGAASKVRATTEITVTDLHRYVECAKQLDQHERDAALGAFAASAMLRQADGWRDISVDEPDPFTPVAPIEYWMPLR